MKCSLCTRDIHNLKQFVWHLEYSHARKNNYECPSCGRCISRRDCFKKHLLTEHKNMFDEPEIVIDKQDFHSVFPFQDLSTNPSVTISKEKKIIFF